MTRVLSALALLLFISAALVSPASASITILDTHGFEAPDFDITFGPTGPGTGTGQLEGQPVTPPEETWQKSLDPGTSIAEVQTAVVLNGAQAVRLDRGAGDSNVRWGVPLTGYPLSQLDQILINWNMRVEGPAGATGAFGPFFGVEAYAAPGGGPTLLGSLGVDASTGDVLYQDAGTGFFIAPGATVAFGAWNAFEILLDYATQTYSVFLNNVQLAGGIGFVDGLFTTFSDADLTGLAEGIGAGFPDTGTAYYDDFIITTNAVPEPGSLLVWAGLALLGVSASAVGYCRAAVSHARSSNC